MPNYPVVLLIYPRQKPRYIHQSQDRYVESITKPDEACSLDGGIDVKRASVNLGLVRHDPNRIPVESGESDDDILSPERLYLEQFASIDDPGYDIPDIVRLVGVVRQDIVELTLVPDGWFCLGSWRVLGVVGWDEAQEFPDLLESFLLVLCEKVRDSALCVVESCSSKFFEINVLIENGFDDVWSRYENVTCLVDHDGEIRHGRGIDRPSRAWTHHSRYLRDHSRG